MAGESTVGFSMYEGHMEAAECICVNVGVNLVGSCHKAAQVSIVDQLVRSAKNEILFNLSEMRIRRRLDDTVKACV